VLQCINGTSTILGLINSFVVVVEVRYVTICFVQYFLNLNAQEITVSKLINSDNFVAISLQIFCLIILCVCRVSGNNYEIGALAGH